MNPSASEWIDKFLEECVKSADVKASASLEEVPAREGKDFICVGLYSAEEGAPHRGLCAEYPVWNPLPDPVLEAKQLVDAVRQSRSMSDEQWSKWFVTLGDRKWDAENDRWTL